ncbi:hypothetical protein THAOC_19016 [Thalassiosira oceanica]|uniref:J domain-containing protein n=1 Tax=Thalassiosira oceanica TaxID=159749 RepID=K0SQG8_THAOC|nr:hypothetical protein THAOC_19016 [Thalassiosira oceanica]|eukprot:EJK60597.1 hypothetical protein THAOC_19016 [Thalassiosira oceanica]
MGDPYEILGVGRDASPDDVKRAYVEMSLRYHPDRNGSNGRNGSGGSDGAEKGREERYAEVREAYDLLKDGTQVRRREGPTTGKEKCRVPVSSATEDFVGEQNDDEDRRTVLDAGGLPSPPRRPGHATRKPDNGSTEISHYPFSLSRARFRKIRTKSKKNQTNRGGSTTCSARPPSTSTGPTSSTPPAIPSAPPSPPGPSAPRPSSPRSWASSSCSRALSWPGPLGSRTGRWRDGRGWRR